MGIVTSGQIAVKPVRITTTATLEQIADAAAARTYPIDPSQPSVGWGSLLDDEAPIGLPISVGIRTGRTHVESPSEDSNERRLRLRYYWTSIDSRAQKLNPGSARWSVVNVLNAADLLFYQEADGSFTVLITMRTDSPFKVIVHALEELLLTVDDTPSVQTENLSESLSEDFFLWLVDIDQRGGDIGDGIVLTCINEISSKDRMYRSARFKDTANAERVEVAALIAKGKVGFGPAKLTITSELHEATFNVEFHLDGGFQPLRSSEYDETDHGPTDFGIALVDDIWTSVLPTIRRRYAQDTEWDATRRSDLRESALDDICAQLGLVRPNT
jgi:hypothetical protein